MSAAANVIAFPAEGAAREFIAELSGSADERLYSVVDRLNGLEAMLYYIKNADDIEPHVRKMLCGIENAVRDCLMVAELRPVGEQV